MPRIQGLAELFFSGDTLVKSAKGEIHQITITQVGGAAGQQVVLKDGTNAAGTPLATFVFSGTNGTLTKEWPQGKAFTTGLFIDVQGAGTVQGDCTFK
jgi:hypothetical protein